MSSQRKLRQMTAPIHRGTAAHVPRRVSLSVSRNIVHNPSICLRSVSRHVRAVAPQSGGTVCLHYVPEHVQEVALQTGRRCHYHRTTFPAGCRSRTVQQTCLISVLKKVKVKNKLGRQYCSESTKRNWKVCGQKREQHQTSER